ncbi:DUF4931 domain-containing protein [Clostridium sp. SM-530-WT-3G]|uniref:DUF4931 domain-containing protein n=1 Tax=Clostridium sp. SM-530-WT-3G TaxID=2725303 RepID=UPI00145F2B23|nr:DUF4931 domain-containing protein [Clostridium sp. SM-530-WT-3G]
MEKEKYIIFLNDISKEKPNDFYKKGKSECPFCKRELLTNIIDEKGPFMLLKNKYPTMKNTCQLVLIETYKCQGNMSEYSDEYIKELIQFGVSHWLEMEKYSEYASVIFYKNHGPRSGGSLKHPHMQIVGLKDIDYRLKLKDEYFKGLSIYKSDLCEVNLSDRPYSGFSEFNVIIEDNLEGLDELSRSMKKITHYILNNYFAKCDSFNIFFYHWNNKIICKISPRFTTSPLLLGYSIRQISSCAEEIADKLKELYYK